MKNYLVYKEEIRGFTEVSEAVKTVEKIAASSIGRFRQEMTNLDEYQLAIRNALGRLSLFHEAERRNGKTAGAGTVLIILTSDKGLTGGLWRRITDVFLQTVRQNYDVIIPIGSKGEKYLKEEKVPVQEARLSDDRTIQTISEKFQDGSFSRIDILYPAFRSLLEYQPVIVPFLPVRFKPDASAPGLPIIEPAGATGKIFDRLVKKYIASYFQKIIAESRLSEYSARTMAMERAGLKTDELIKGLTLTYRKERRRLLTQKQLESFIAHKSL